MYFCTYPYDGEEERQYHVRFRLTRTSDWIAPARSETEPIVLNIINDTIEGDVAFKCRIDTTSDAAAVRIGPRNEVPVTIVDDNSKYSCAFIVCAYVHMYINA